MDRTDGNIHFVHPYRSDGLMRRLTTAIFGGVHPPNDQYAHNPPVLSGIGPTYFPVTNFIAHAHRGLYSKTMQHDNARIMPVYWYFHCDCQQNIALFCAMSDSVLLLLFADASCLTQLSSIKLFFFREKTLDVE